MSTKAKYQRNPAYGPAGAPDIPLLEASGKTWERRGETLQVAGGAVMTSKTIEHNGKVWEPGSFAIINTGSAVLSRKEGEPHVHIVLFEDGTSYWARPTADGQAIETLTADPAPAITTVKEEAKPKEETLPEEVWVYAEKIEDAEPFQSLNPNGTFTVKGLKGRYFGDPKSRLDFVAELYRIYSTGGKYRTIRVQSVHSDLGYTLTFRWGSWYQLCLCDPQPKEPPYRALHLVLLFAMVCSALTFLLSLFSPSILTALLFVATPALLIGWAATLPQVFLLHREAYMPTMPPTPTNSVF